MTIRGSIHNDESRSTQICPDPTHYLLSWLDWSGDGFSRTRYRGDNESGCTDFAGVWIALDLLGSLVIVPLAIVSLLTGLVMSLGTKWGLFQHYWVLFSFALTILAILILLGNMQSVRFLAGTITDIDNSNVDMLRAGLQSELLHAGVGLLVLVVIQVLNIYKPRGLTSYGWRKQQEQRAFRQAIDAEA